MPKKIAFITGITGQDGYYLTKYLLEKNYEIHGLVRRTSDLNRNRIDKIIENNLNYKNRIFLHYGDICDDISIINILKNTKPNEIYHLGAQSHVKISFEIPVYTADATGLGTLKLLESIRQLRINPKIYIAGSSEMYGDVTSKFQNEKTPFNPRSPYGVSKVFSFYIGKNYREIL